MEENEFVGSLVTACGSTRCRFNKDLKCTANLIKIGRGGDCKTEDWVGVQK